MWVKIKSNKIPNVVLTVPYSAFLNSYKRKGFYIIEDKSAKNKTKTEKVIEQEDKIKLDEEEMQALKEIKESVEQNSTEQVEIVEEKHELTDEEIREHFAEKPKLKITENDNTVALNGRTPPKKAPVSKR